VSGMVCKSSADRPVLPPVDDQQYRILLDAVTDYAIYMLDPAGIVTSWNAGAQRFKGYRADEVIGRDFAMFYAAADQARGEPQGALATARGRGRFECEGWRVRKDGSHFWASVVITPIHDGIELVGFAKITRDISERREAELRLAAAATEAAQHATMLKLSEDMAGVGTWSWDVATDRTTWSDQTYRIHGYPIGVETPPLQGVLARYHPDDAKLLGDCVQRAVSEGRDYALEARIYRPDGSERQVIARGACLRDAGGAISTIVGTFQDITEYLTTSRFIRTLADNLPGLVAYWDSTLHCQFSNAAYSDWFGVSPATMLKITLPELLGPELLEKNKRHISGVLNGQRQTFPRTLVKPSGEICHTLSHYIPDIDSSGQTQGFYVLVSDVTPLKIAEEKLQETNALLVAARDQAEAATAVKAEFMANISHELRTPLNSIIGFSELLKPCLTDDPKSHHYATRISHAAAVLLTEVNDILDFSKLEAGQVEIELHPVQVGAFLENSIGLMVPQAAAKALALTCDIDRAPDTALMLDGARLRQVLLNLTSNAVKFTGEGSVTVSVAPIADDQWLRFEVRDTGSGIPAERLDRLFKRFSQVDASTARLHGGTGLGLAICKGLVEAMGGVIGVTSTLGEGSTFFFEVPLLRADVDLPPDPDHVEHDADTIQGLSLLIVDDNEANRELVRLISQSVGLDVVEADCGEVAVSTARGQPFDLILMDIRMPGMGGEAAARAIVDGAGPNADTPILAFSADLATSFEPSGPFSGTIAKPIAPAVLVNGLYYALAGQRRQRAAAH
jgi:PAS domain S-box-containing protein